MYRNKSIDQRVGIAQQCAVEGNKVCTLEGVSNGILSVK